MTGLATRVVGTLFFSYNYDAGDQAIIVSPTGGGTLAIVEQPLTIGFGSGAVSDFTRISYENNHFVGGLSQISILSSFSLNAVDTNASNITDFSTNPYTLTFEYTSEQEAQFIDGSLRLLYFNEATESWEEVPSVIDYDNRIVTATIDHFTDFAILGDSVSKEGDAIITLASGSLSILPYNIDFSYDINGNPVIHQIQGVSFDVETRSNNWEASDATGTGAGWTVSIRTTQFSDSDPSNDFTIPPENLMVKLEGSMISKLFETSSGLPSSSQPGYVVLDDITPVIILTAVGPDGMGSYVFSPDFKLTVPADIYQGLYTSVVTVDIQVTP